MKTGTLTAQVARQLARDFKLETDLDKILSREIQYEANKGRHSLTFLCADYSEYEKVKKIAKKHGFTFRAVGEELCCKKRKHIYVCVEWR